MTKCAFIFLYFFSFVAYAGNEGGNGGDEAEISWKANTAKIISGLEFLIKAKEIGEIDLTYIKSLELYTLSASESNSGFSIDQIQKIVFIAKKEYGSLSTEGQFCKTWETIYNSSEVLRDLVAMDCTYLYRVSTFVDSASMELNIGQMISICSSKDFPSANSYDCTLGNRKIGLSARDVLEAVKRASVLVDPSICKSFDSPGSFLSIKTFTYMGQLECTIVKP